MGTSNFHYINNLFTIDDVMEYYCESCCEYVECEKCEKCNCDTNQSYDEYYYENTKENIYYDLSKTKLKGVKCISIDKESPYSLHSYYRAQFIDLYKYVNNRCIGLKVTVTGGYYTGASFDYDIYIDSDYYTLEEQFPYKAQIMVLVREVEKVLKQYTTQLGVLGTFSNGETIYNKK